MSKLARALVLGAMLAAMNLAGMTTVAQAQANDEGKDARRPPTERQVGGSPGVSLRSPRRSRPPRTPPSGGSWPESASPSPQADESSGQPGWLVPLLAVLAAALAVSGGLAVMAAKRASRRVRAGHA